MKARFIVISLCLFLITIAAVGFWFVNNTFARTVRIAEDHTAFRVTHPGWSFPSMVYTSPATLEGSKERMKIHARARGYVEACPPKLPGSWCPKSGDYHLRGGEFPEGKMPAAIARAGEKPQGWTVPAAFEPVLMGMLLGPLGEWRVHISPDAVPKNLVASLLASEDANFRSHHGVDFAALLRAGTKNVRDKQYSQGGSTLTMQVVRNFTGSKQRTLGRKAAEIVAALSLDHYLGKDRILAAYLDIPYLGQRGSVSVCGFAAAAWHYFGVPVQDLTLSQAATLVGILPSPARFSPFTAPEAAIERRNLVLDRVGKLGLMPPAEVAAARAEKLVVSEGPMPEERYPGYLGAVRSFLLQKLGPDAVYGAGLHVFTGLDVAAQEQSDRLLDERVKMFEGMLPVHRREPLQAAAVAIVPESGRVVALYAGRNATSDGFNRATQARRQGGSAFKPVVHAAAYDLRDESGKPRYTPATSMPNSLRDFKTPGRIWRPRNVGGEYTLRASLDYALVWSQNIATASLLEDMGIGNLTRFAERAGFDTGGWPGELGLALGQGEVTVAEMARFCAMVANGGMKVDFFPVELATDAAGKVRLSRPEPGPRVMRPGDTGIVRLLMQQVVNSGTGGHVRGAGGYGGYGGPMMGKTGTTNKERDLWFIGGSPDYSGALWIGFDEPAGMVSSASDVAAPLFGWWQRALHTGMPQRDFPAIPGIISRQVCNISGKRPVSGCPSLPAPFLEDTAPTAACPGGHTEKVPNAAAIMQGEMDDDTTQPADGGVPAAVVPEKKKRQTIWDKPEDAGQGTETDGGR
ncbi:MAG: transglycosylase domain-containing protein [Myxococcota bacterium]|jgi:penicillin-binding protein 1B